MTPDECKATYRRMIDIVGESVVIRRYTGIGEAPTVTNATVRARVIGYAAAELVGPIQQGDQKLIVLYEDLVAEGFPVPLRKDDKAVVGGRELNIEAPDGNTRRIQGVVIAYELQVRG